MKMRWAVFLLLATLALGGKAASLQQPDAITGTVLTPDGKPTANATVWLVVNRWEVGHMTVESSTTTDARGRFRLTFKPPLRVYSAYIIAFHPDFAVGWKSFDPRDLKPVTVRLHRPEPLAGVVLTPDGKPLSDVKVQVRRIFGVGTRMAFEMERQDFWLSGDMPEAITPLWVTTDEQGRFAFHHLPARAQVTLLASHPDFAPTQLPPPQEWLPVRTGQVNVALVMVPKSFVTGQVLADGEPAANAQVICLRLWGLDDRLRFTADAEGRFKGVLLEGSWLIHAVADEGQWQREPQYIAISPGETVSVTLNLSRAVEVRGVVKDAEKKTPVPFAAVTAYRDLDLPEVRTSWRTEEVKADEKGAYRLFLLPGKWTVNAWASYAPGHYASAQTVLNVQSGTVKVPDLLLQTPSQKVRVQVVDPKGKPIPQAIVTDRWNPTRADEHGIAQMPTSFHSFWAATPDMTMFGEAEVKPDMKSVRIVVRKGVPVSGQVTDEKGKPIAHARLRIQALQLDEEIGREFPHDWYEVAADAQGRFRFHLPVGQRFQVMAFAPNFFPIQTKPFMPEKGKPMRLSVRLLRPDLTIEGTIFDGETGKPIWGAIVKAAMFWSGFSPGEFGSRVAFTDPQGQFRLTGLRRDRMGDFEIWHPAYEPFRQFRPDILPQGRIPLERRRPRISPQLAEGKPAPPLSDVRWLDGEPPSLQGATTYLLFAMPFNPACEQTLQRLKEVQAKGEGQVIVVFDASLPVDELRHYVQERQLPFHIGVALTGQRLGWDSETFQRYGIKSVPFLVVIDAKGIVQAIK